MKPRKLQIQKARYPNTCLLTSFAMALGVDQEDIIKAVGHNGSHQAWPHLSPPQCYIGHHPQELIDYCLSKGYAVTCIELDPVSAHRGLVSTVYHHELGDVKRLQDYANNNVCVLVSDSHAMACCNGIVYDPKGYADVVENVIHTIRFAFLIHKFDCRKTD